MSWAKVGTFSSFSQLLLLCLYQQYLNVLTGSSETKCQAPVCFKNSLQDECLQAFIFWNPASNLNVYIAAPVSYEQTRLAEEKWKWMAATGAVYETQGWVHQLKHFMAWVAVQTKSASPKHELAYNTCIGSLHTAQYCHAGPGTLLSSECKENWPSITESFSTGTIY